MTFCLEGRIKQCRISDIKYHFILMNGGVGTVGLDSIESWFRDPKKVRIIESEVRVSEERLQKQSRKRVQIPSLLKDLESAAEIGAWQLCIFIAKRYIASLDDAICD